MDDMPLKPAQGLLVNQLNEFLLAMGAVLTKELETIQNQTKDLENVIRLLDPTNKP